MAEPLDRDEVIGLLDRLGSDQDKDVLEAARALHARVNAAGLVWDELLTAESPAEPVDTSDATESPAELVDTSDAAESPAEPVETSDAAESPAGKTRKDGSTLDLIEELLAKSDRSDSLREELEEYKADIANGEFRAGDHQYLRSLHARLTK